jgi:murein DD-endopeptidase MepM/ murein hydrolase activator NlpD
MESVVTSVYGSQRLYNKIRTNFHNGVDFRAQVGTPIAAPQGGEVILAQDLYFTGWTVILDHGYGILTLYAHMSKLDVKVGQRVRKGEQLGLSGATGRVSGPHLHWGAIIHKQKVNALDLVKVLR